MRLFSRLRPYQRCSIDGKWLFVGNRNADKEVFRIEGIHRLFMRRKRMGDMLPICLSFDGNGIIRTISHGYPVHVNLPFATQYSTSRKEVA